MRNKYGNYPINYRDFLEETEYEGFEREFFGGAIKVKFEFKFDEWSIPDHLGEYGRHYQDGCIDRQKNGDRGWNEYQYFYPAISKEYTKNWYIQNKNWHPRAATIQAGYEANQDYARMEAFNKQKWHYVYVKVSLFVDGKMVNDETSFSVESDSEKEYFWDMIRETLSKCIKTYRKELKESLQHQQWAVKA